MWNEKRKTKIFCCYYGTLPWFYELPVVYSICCRHKKYHSNTNFYSSGDFSAIIYADSSVESIDITVDLQKKGLFGYSTVETLSETFYNSYAIYEDSFNLDSSETYRIKVTFEVFTADDSESTVKYANE